MKFTYDSKDDFSRELLIKYAYLYEIGRIMLEKKSQPKDINQFRIPIEKVGLAVIEAHPDFTRPEIDAYVSNLAIEGYLKILSDKPDKSEMYHLVEQKGLSAITSGEFLKQFEARQRDLLQVELTKSTKSTNYWVKRTSIISVVIAAIIGYYLVRQAINDLNRNPSSTDTRLQKKVPLLDSMTQFQKGINSSLRKAVKDSFYQKHP